MERTKTGNKIISGLVLFAVGMCLVVLVNILTLKYGYGVNPKNITAIFCLVIFGYIGAKMVVKCGENLLGDAMDDIKEEKK